jgi:hypothetical protein
VAPKSIRPAFFFLLGCPLSFVWRALSLSLFVYVSSSSIPFVRVGMAIFCKKPRFMWWRKEKLYGALAGSQQRESRAGSGSKSERHLAKKKQLGRGKHGRGSAA